MSGTRKRRGTTLVELSLVIAILAMVALPFVAFVSQNLKNTVLSSTQLKEQMVLEQVMQDMEKHLRSAVRTPPMELFNADNPGDTDKIVFTSRDPQPRPIPDSDPLTIDTTSLYTYELKADGLFYKNDVVFPDGLEAGVITSLKFLSATTTPSGEESLEPTTPPCYLTVRMEAYNPTLQTTTALQKTIYLRNYTSTVNVARILGVTRVLGDTQVAEIDGTEYTGTVGWFPSEPFVAGETYTATITLTAKTGFSWTGLMEDFFTVEGATTTTNPDTRVVTAVFPPIGATVITIRAILGVTPPVKGVHAVKTITPTAQYTGTVVWTGDLTGGGDFKNKTVYTATITIIPNPGYTLTGVAANFFTVDGASVAVPNAINEGVVTTGEFPMTGN